MILKKKEEGETNMTVNNNNKDNSKDKDIHIVTPCQEHFKLFSYLAMTIMTSAIIVGVFLVIQHLSEEDETEKSLANQESLLNATKHITKNQDLIQVVINETRRDNTKFFEILDFMVNNATLRHENATNLIDEVTSNNAEQIHKINKKLDKIIRQLNMPSSSYTNNFTNSSSSP